MPETGRGADAEAPRQQIAERAYALWEQEGRPHGCDLDHWLRAEAEIIAAGAKPPNSAASPASRGKKPEQAAERSQEGHRDGRDAEAA